jgi:hypothetical protein
MLLAAALALSLSAAPAAPFPPPRAAPPGERLKCDTGSVLAVSAEKGQLQVATTAGVVTYRAGNEVQVFDRAGVPAGAVSRLEPGQKVRVYYVVEDGARALEVDVEG